MIARQGRSVAKHAAERLKEAFGRLVGSPLLPPPALRDVGPGDFEEIGREFLGHFVSLGSLQPAETILEIGCGPGRMALPLTRYLNHEGRYVGVDIVSRAVAWCRRNISPQYPNFTFEHADVLNQRYNPEGRVQAHDYTFPFDDAGFDFIFLTSVFTHMYPADIQHYLREIVRMLRPTGRLFSTFFILNEEQRILGEKGKNDIVFRFARGIYRIRNEAIPESAVAVKERALREMFDVAGLVIQEPIHFGGWSGREDGLSLQDIVLAVPAAGSAEEQR
jgi:SAM-dependent methyltransferase